VPRDRNSRFEPQLVRKNQARFDGLDDKIISLYSRGMTQREIQGHLEEIYGVEVSSSLISTVTGAVLDEARAWQTRPSGAVYPILYLDALQVKVKSQGRVTNKAIYLAFGVNLQGLKEVPVWTRHDRGGGPGEALSSHCYVKNLKRYARARRARVIFIYARQGTRSRELLRKGPALSTQHRMPWIIGAHKQLAYMCSAYPSSGIFTAKISHAATTNKCMSGKTDVRTRRLQHSFS
jgi:hypothetical protein